MSRKDLILVVTFPNIINLWRIDLESGSSLSLIKNGDN